MADETKTLALFTRHGDVFFALGAIAIIGILIIPMPSFVLDIFLSLNLAGSFAIFLLTIYVKRPLPSSCWQPYFVSA